jgi:hypothetical protein
MRRKASRVVDTLLLIEEFSLLQKCPNNGPSNHYREFDTLLKQKVEPASEADIFSESYLLQRFATDEKSSALSLVKPSLIHF